MEIKVYIPLSKDAALALSKLADQERRDPKPQASLIIENELIRLKLIQPNKGTQVQGSEEVLNAKPNR